MRKNQGCGSDHINADPAPVPFVLCNAEQDPAFLFNADPDPAIYLRDAYLRPLVKKPERAPF